MAFAVAVLRTVLDPLPYWHAGQLVALVETDDQAPPRQTNATARDVTRAASAAPIWRASRLDSMAALKSD